MGIDARILVRHKGKPISEAELLQKSVQMTSLLGAEKFFIRRKPLWKDDKPSHALTFCPTVAEARAQDHWVPKNLPDQAQVYWQDGDPIIQQVGEQLIKCHVWSRYYGEGYERGDWLFLAGLMDYLEFAFPEAEIWYGGDSSGVVAEHFDATRRKELTDYFYGVAHRPYRGAFGMFGGKPKQTCEFCGGHEMDHAGGGQGKEYWHCDGCNLKRVVTADAVTDLEDGKDFF